MKIGIDCRIYSEKFTGIGRYTKELVERLLEINKKAGYPHQFILFFNDPEFSKFKTSRNVQKVRVNARHYSFSEQIRFPKIIRQYKPDLMHFTHFNLPLFYNEPFTVTIHDLTLTHFPGRKMTRFYHRLAYHLTIKHAIRRARRVIAISEHTKSDILRHFKVAKNKIKVIYNGLSPDFAPLKNPAGAEKTLKKYKIEAPFLLYTGVWRNHKNLPNLIRAFSILRKKHKLDLRLVLTGNPSKHYPEVRAAIVRHKLKPHVITPGLVSETELRHLYAAAQFYVFPSLYEGFGLPLLEAMASGTPTLASETSSIPEICGDAALYFDPTKPHDIANQINSLYKNPEKQAQLVAKGFRRAAQFSWDEMAHETYKVLTQSK